MLQSRQDLALLTKTLHQTRGGLRQQLERNALFVLSIAALGQMHFAHATATDQAQQPVGTELARSRQIFLGPGNAKMVQVRRAQRTSQELVSVDACVSSQHAAQALLHWQVAGALFQHIRLAIAGRQVQRGIEQRRQACPACGVQLVMRCRIQCDSRASQRKE